MAVGHGQKRRAARVGCAPLAALGLLTAAWLIWDRGCEGFVFPQAQESRRARVARGAEESKESRPVGDKVDQLFAATAKRRAAMDERRSLMEEKEKAALDAIQEALDAEPRDLKQLEAAVALAEEADLKPSETQDARRIIVEERGGGLMWVNHASVRSFEVEWEKDDTIDDLKSVIFQVSRVPKGMQVLKAYGDDLGEDRLLLADVRATAKGRVPEVWLFDQRDREDVIADDFDDIGFYSDPGDDRTFSPIITALFSGVLILFVGSQIAGVNPFIPDKAGQLIDPFGVGMRDTPEYVRMIEQQDQIEAPSKIPKPFVRDKEGGERQQFAWQKGPLDYGKTPQR